MNPFEQSTSDRCRILYYRNIDKKGLVGTFGIEIHTDFINFKVCDMCLKRSKNGDLYIDVPKKKFTNKEGKDEYFSYFDVVSPKDQYISYRNKIFNQIMQTLRSYFDSNNQNQDRRDLNGQQETISLSDSMIYPSDGKIAVEPLKSEHFFSANQIPFLRFFMNGAELLAKLDEKIRREKMEYTPKNPRYRLLPYQKRFTSVEVMHHLGVTKHQLRRDILAGALQPIAMDDLRLNYFSYRDVLKYIKFLEEKESEDKKSLTLTKSAEYLAVDKNVIRALTLEGKLECKETSKQKLYKIEDLDKVKPLLKKKKESK